MLFGDKAVSSHLQPFVKWAGGKRQLLSEIAVRMPESFNRYYEPFVGGGALLLALQPQNAVINDINTSLVNAYRQIKENSSTLVEALEEIDSSQGDEPKVFYYEKREEYNSCLLNEIYNARTAALLIYLNKHCFNGLYRVNAKGLFNVPYNNSSRPSFNAGNLLAISDYLQKVDILNTDFEEACKGAKKGDFVFFDSPYAPINPTSFESYTKEGFSLEDHERLARLYRDLTKRGCYCMLTNHNTDLINELYEGYSIDVVQVKRSINSDASRRIGTEVIITNY